MGAFSLDVCLACLLAVDWTKIFARETTFLRQGERFFFEVTGEYEASLDSFHEAKVLMGRPCFFWRDSSSFCVCGNSEVSGNGASNFAACLLFSLGFPSK